MQIHSIPRSWNFHQSIAAVIFAIGFCGVVLPLERVAFAEQPEEPTFLSAEKFLPEKIEAMIDALASRNRPPKLIELPEGFGLQPIFPPDYDWKEQDRVRDAILELKNYFSVEMHKRLIAHRDDKRYCLTYNDGAAMIDHAAEHLTVGEICGRIANVQYGALLHDAEGLLNDGEPPYIQLPYRDFSKPARPVKKEDKPKPFYEEQIELCEAALRSLPELRKSERGKRIDPNNFIEAKASIQTNIDKLKKTKRPIIGVLRVPFERYELFNAKRAEEIRMEYEAALKRGELKESAKLPS